MTWLIKKNQIGTFGTCLSKCSMCNGEVRESRLVKCVKGYRGWNCRVQLKRAGKTRLAAVGPGGKKQREAWPKSSDKEPIDRI